MIKRLWCRFRYHPNMDRRNARQIGIGRVVPERYYGEIIMEADCPTCGPVQWWVQA